MDKIGQYVRGSKPGMVGGKGERMDVNIGWLGEGG